MNKTKILLTLLILMPLVSPLIFCTKNIGVFEVFKASEKYPDKIETLVDEIEFGEYSNVDIAEKFKKIAKAERKLIWY